MRAFESLLIVCALLVSCGGEPDDPPKPPPKKPKLSPVPEVSFPKIEEQKQLTFEGPSEPIPLRWRFPAGTKLAYAIDQVSRIRDMAQKGAPQMNLKSGGGIAIQTRENGKTYVKFKLWKKMAGTMDKEPTILDYLIEENGDIDPITRAAAGTSGLQLDILLALPKRPLLPGESFERKISIRTRGYRMGQEGIQKITLTGFVKIERYACVRLESEIDIRLVSAPGGKLEGGGRMKGRIIAYFAYEEGFFVRIDAAALMKVRAFTEYEGENVKEYRLITTDLDTRVKIRKK